MSEVNTTNWAAWRRRNAVRKVITRLRYPWPFYKAVGGLNAVINHADGTHTDLGRASVTYAKRWGVGAK